MAKGLDKPSTPAGPAEHGRLFVPPFGVRPLRTFALVIALPAFLLYVASVALVIVVLGIMAQNINRIEAEHGMTGLHAALGSFLNDLGNAVADEGTWDEAYRNVVVTPDPAWMDATWGAAARLGQSYDGVLVTDQAGDIIFGETGAGAIKGNIAERFPAAKAMLRDLNQRIAATGDATTISRFAADKNGPAGIAAISIHQNTLDGLTVPRQTRRILWIARHITPALLQDIASRYQTPLATLATRVDPDQSSIDLVDADGSTAGTIAWTPDHPGDAASTQVLLIATSIFFAIGLAMVLGLGMIRRAMLRRAAAVEASLANAAAGAAIAPVLNLARKAVAAAIEDDPVLHGPIDGITAADFEIEYQPIFDLRAETLIGAEALLRWRKPDKTLLLQESLTPAENIALLELVGILALRHAADEMAPLLGMMLTITITPGQLRAPVFAEKIAGTLGATNFPASRLQLAINTNGLPPVAEIREPIAGLRRSGISIALSDFVLGPATTPYVQPNIADRIRLPEAMVRDIDTDPIRYALVETTIGAAKTAGWAVTVPFVERKEEASKLLRLGCREFEGKLFAEPMPIAALTALILKPAAKKAG